MAVVGEAHIIVRAITDQVKDDIKRGFDGASYSEGRRAGQDSAKGFGDGFGRGTKRSGMFSNLAREAMQAGAAFNRLVTTGYALGPALAGLVGIIGGIGGGLFALGAQAAAAIPSLFALVNALSAVAQAAAVLKVVFSGVGAAISAGMNQGGGGGGGGGGLDLSRQIEDAKERIEDARKNIAKVYQQNAEALKRSNQQITDALEAEVEAYENLEEAERDVQRSQEDLAKAQQEVTEARKEAAEQIQQLRFELEESVLSEERASMSLEKAQERLAKAQALPPDNRLRREAELEFKEAELRLRRAKDRTSDLSSEVDEANRKGVEGSDVVVAAKEREKQAEEGLANAKKNVERAEKDLARASREVTEAYDNYNATLAENKTRLEDARDALKDAKEALEDLQNQAGAGGGGGGVDAFAEAMAKLSPKAQEFVRLILEIAKAFEPIKKLAQEEFFGRINDDVRELADIYLPILEEKIPKTAAILGEVAEGIAKVFKDPENVERFTAIWDSNDRIIRQLGKALANLAEIFLILLENAAPVAERFAKWVSTLTKTWKETLNAKDKTGELADTFSYAGDVAAQLGDIFGNVFSAIMNIGKAASGPGSGGEMLLDLLQKATASWEKFTGSEEGQARLTKFFQNIVPLVSEFGGLIGDIFKAIFTTAEAGTQGEEGGPLAAFVRSLREVVAIGAEMGPNLLGVLPTIGEGLVSAATAVSNLTSSGAIQTFFDVLAGFAKIVADITSSPLFQQIFAIAAPIFAASRALSLVFNFLKFIFLGAIVSNVAKFAGYFKTLAGVIQTVVFNFRLLAFGLGIGSGPLLAIAAAVAAVVAVFVLMWQNSEKLRERVGELIKTVIEKAVSVFENLKKKLDEALAPLGGLEGAVQKLGEVFGFLGDVVADYIVPLFENYLVGALDVVEAILGTIIDTVGNLISGFMKIWEGIQEGDVGKIFEGIAEAILAPFTALWDNLSQLFIDLWNNIVKTVKEVLGISSPSQVFADIAQGIIDGLINVLTFLPRLVLGIFEGAFNKALEIVTTAWNGIKSAIETVVNWFRDIAAAVINTVIGLIKGYFRAVQIVVETVWGAIEDAIDAVVSWLRDDAEGIILGVWNAIKTAAETLKTKIEEYWTAIETKINAVGTWLRNILQGTITAVWTAIQNAADTLKTKIQEYWDAIKTKVNEIGNWLKNTLQGTVTGVWTAIQNAADTLKTKLGEIWDGIKTKINGVVNDVKDKVGTIWDGITGALTKVKNALIGENGNGGIWGTIKDKVTEIVGTISGAVSGVWNGLLGGLQSIWGSVKSWWNANVARSITVDPPFGPTFEIKIPTLAQGGIIPATRGGMLAIVGEGGRDERVEPLDSKGLSKRDYAIIDYLTGGMAGSGGATINVYPSPGMDEREIAEKVSRELAFMMRRGSV